MRRKMEKGEKDGERLDDRVLEKRDVGLIKRGKGQRLHGGFSFQQMLTIILAGWVMLYVFLGPRVDAQALSQEQLEDLKKFLEEHNPGYTNFTYDQLKQWFEAQTPEAFRWEEYPRLYPFCVTAGQVNDSRRTRESDHIYKFLEIFEDIERINEKFYNFNVNKHSMIGNKNWIEKIEMSRINTPEVDMVNLRQWLHIKVTTKHPMKALYLQSIVGPMGLPFGEFFLDFPCKDDLAGTADIDKVGQLTYCSYRPRTTIQHPSVYVGFKNETTTVFHAHFFWTDITCMETPYLQFLMIAVKDFNFNSSVQGKPKLGENYQPLLSPIYLNTDFDSKSGAPFPYYPEWKDRMYCFIPSSADLDQIYKQNGYEGFPSNKTGADPAYEPIVWVVEQNATRIQANEVYDACIVNKSRHLKHERDDERLECPPGPFRCDTSYAGNDTNRTVVTMQRQQLVKQEQNLSDCFPCGAPPCIELGYPEHKCDYKADKLYKDTNESTTLNKVESLIRAKTHGVQATFAFLFLVPIANFMARFYKEMCGKCLCGNGPWIFVHVIAHVCSLVFMWISLGPVLPRLTEINEQRKECNALYRNDTSLRRACIIAKSANNPHTIVALIAFAMQHFLVLMGFWRTSNSKIRLILVALHSHFGYFCWILGAIATMIAGLQFHLDDCPDIFILAMLFFFTPLLFSAAGVALDCMTDCKVGIIPPRRQWPILETIKLEGRGPFTMPKWIVFGLYVGVMFFWWLILLASSLKIVGGTNNILKANITPVPSFFGGRDCSNAKALTAAENSGRFEPDRIKKELSGKAFETE